MNDTTLTKVYYSLRATAIVLKKLCRSSMSNPSISCRVNLREDNPNLAVTLTRPAYDSTGYHVGSEAATFIIALLTREEITGGSSGIFDLMDRWMVDFENARITDMTHPEATQDDASGEGYYPPDSDFWWEEFQREVQFPVTNEHPHYEFVTEDEDGNKGRFWRITGEYEQYVWNLDVLGHDQWDDHLINDLDGFSA